MTAVGFTAAVIRVQFLHMLKLHNGSFTIVY